MSLNLPEKYLELASFDAAGVREVLERIQRNFKAIARAASLPQGVIFGPGQGDPNGLVKASPGAVYLRADGGAGTSFYVKESGVNTNTGWVGK